MHLFQKIVLSIYRAVNKVGLLQFPWTKRLFWIFYCWYKQYFEDPFFGLSRKYPALFRGGNILDIGANIGYTTIVFSKAIADDFKVYAFEPDRDNFLMLKEAIARCKTKNIIIPIHAAVGETTGTIEFWHNEKHHADCRVVTEDYRKSGLARRKISVVPMQAIDSFVSSEIEKTAVKFIKIDVQGYELPVCYGMQQTLAANPDLVVALEYAPQSMVELGFSPQKLLEFFEAKKYFIYVLARQGQLALARREQIERLVDRRGYIDLIFSKQKIVKI
ncbi:MAG: FkbM family methyltransferase [Hydrococcus sp. Prado102]|jgi:FkbM family methyltransferase|nr:FkbM family methyltransferase [Hydrococcus sp. Prado102]